MAKLSKLQGDMLEALSWLASDPNTFRAHIALRGAGQYAAARALHRKGLARLYPSGILEPNPDIYATGRVRLST